MASGSTRRSGRIHGVKGLGAAMSGQGVGVLVCHAIRM